MPIDRRTKVDIVRKFLQHNPRYLELGLAVEEAMKSLREAKAEKVATNLRPKIHTVARRGPNWDVTHRIKYRKTGQPPFWCRLYKSGANWENHWAAGVWVARWNPQRLVFEICVERWPADVDLKEEIRGAFHEFTKDSEHGDFWSEDGRNSSEPWPRVSWHFDGDGALVSIGEVDEAATAIVDLLAGLVEELVETADRAKGETGDSP